MLSMRIPVPFPCLPQKWNEAEEVGCQRPAWEWESAAQGKILGKRTRSTGNALATLLKQRGSLRAVTKHRFLPAAIAVTICSAQSSAALRSRRVQVRLAGQTEKGALNVLPHTIQTPQWLLLIATSSHASSFQTSLDPY